MIKKFTVFGERCSGTNFLEQAILQNFNLEITWDYGWKHWIGHHQFQNTEREDETLFIGIIREPVGWIDSFFKKPHHLPYHHGKNIQSFIQNEFYSLQDNGSENMLDRNYLTKERYKNIFECRYYKNKYLIEMMPKLVKHYMLIRYEDLLQYYELTLKYIKQKFELTQKYTYFKKINTYKGSKNNESFHQKPISLPAHVHIKILDSLNQSQEQSLGYIKKKKDPDEK